MLDSAEDWGHSAISEMVPAIQELTDEWERKTQNKLWQSSVFGARTTGRGVEDEFVPAGVEQEVMEGSLELSLENQQAFLSRRNNMSSQGHRGWEQLASCWRKLSPWA